MFVNTIVSVALLATAVSAQIGANSTIDPNSIDLTMRSQWCGAEMNTCGTLCSGSYNENSCDQNTLNYTCTCTSNNSAPGLAYYTGTIPTFICEQVYANCINENAGVQAGQAMCTTNRNNDCGTLDPTKFSGDTTSSSSSSSSATATATSTGSSSGAAATVSSTSTHAGAAPTVMPGTMASAGMVAAGVAAAFGMML